MMPETRYARSGDVSIAYQVVGSEPFDVVFVPPGTSQDRGVHELKGIPGEWRLYAAV